MITERLPLSIGAPPAQKVAGLVFGLVFAAAGAAFTLLPFVVDGWLQNAFGADESCPSAAEISGIPPDLLPPAVRECVSDGSWFTGGDVGPMRLIGLLGIPFVLVGVYLALSAVRTAGWLEGSRATVRGAVRTRTVDLATARVTAGARTYRRNRETARESIERVPTLIARDPAGGPTVTIPLHGVGLAQLPPPQLRALAEALTGNQDHDARTVAAQLQAMAENPLGLTAQPPR